MQEDTVSTQENKVKTGKWKTVEGVEFDKTWKGKEISNPQIFIDGFLKSKVFREGYYDISVDKTFTGFDEYKKRIIESGEQVNDTEAVRGFLASEKAHYILCEFAKTDTMFVFANDTPANIHNKYTEYQHQLDRVRNPESNKIQREPGEDQYDYRERLLSSILQKDEDRSNTHNVAAHAIEEAIKIDPKLSFSVDNQIPFNFARGMVNLMGISQNYLDYHDVIGAWGNRANVRSLDSD